jgi:hypothetical protein
VDESLFAAAAQRLAQRRRELLPASLARAAWAFGAAGQGDCQLLAGFCTRAGQLLHQPGGGGGGGGGGGFAPTDASALAWGLSVMHAQSPAGQAPAALAALARLAAAAGVAAYGAADLAQLCWAVAAAGVYDADLFAGVAAALAAGGAGGGSEGAAVGDAPVGAGGAADSGSRLLQRCAAADVAALAWSLAAVRHWDAGAMAAAAAHYQQLPGSYSAVDAATLGVALATASSAGAARAQEAPAAADGSAGGAAAQLASSAVPAGAAVCEAAPAPGQLQHADVIIAAAQAAGAPGAAEELEPEDIAGLAWAAAVAGAAAGGGGEWRAAARQLFAAACDWGAGAFSAQEARQLHVAWLLVQLSDGADSSATQPAGQGPGCRAAAQAPDQGRPGAPPDGQQRTGPASGQLRAQELPTRLLAAGKKAAAAATGRVSRSSFCAGVLEAAAGAGLAAAAPHAGVRSSKAAGQLSDEAMLSHVVVQRGGGGGAPLLLVLVPSDQCSRLAGATPSAGAVAAAWALQAAGQAAQVLPEPAWQALTPEQRQRLLQSWACEAEPNV